MNVSASFCLNLNVIAAVSVLPSINLIGKFTNRN